MLASLHAVSRAASLSSYWLGRPWSADRVRRYQDNRIRELVVLTARNNSFYRRIWAEAGVDPLSVRGAADLARLPIVSKRQMQEADAELPPPPVDRSKLVRVRTSGSSGHPMEIRRTFAEDKLLAAFRIRTLADYGLGLRDTRIQLTTSIDGRPERRGARENPWWIRHGFIEYYALDFLTGLQPTLERIRELRPAMIGGHADAIWKMSVELPRHELRSLGLKFITLSVITVTPLMKHQVQEAFGLPTYINYGSSEFNLLAAECPSTGLLHLNELCNYVEVIKDGRPAQDGESGQVVATNLQTELVPFIRFDLGDWAAMGPGRCPCGAACRTLRAVEGRRLDIFRFPGGREVHPFYLANPLSDFVGWLGEYRLIQEREDFIRIPFTLLPGAPAPHDASERVAAAVRSAAGEDVSVEASPVDSLPRFSKGKNRLFESRLTGRRPALQASGVARVQDGPG